MDSDTVERARADIAGTSNAMMRMRKTAGIVCALFGESGNPLAVVGETAVMFYSEGRYVSDSLHMCRVNAGTIPVRLRQRLMGMVDGHGGPSTWDIYGTLVHLHGRMENDSSATPFAVETDYGQVDLIPPEQLLVEYLTVATFPEPNEHAQQMVRFLLRAGVYGNVDFDTNEVSRLAALPAYDVSGPLEAYSLELERENL